MQGMCAVCSCAVCIRGVNGVYRVQARYGAAKKCATTPTVQLSFFPCTLRVLHLFVGTASCLPSCLHLPTGARNAPSHSQKCFLLVPEMLSAGARNAPCHSQKRFLPVPEMLSAGARNLTPPVVRFSRCCCGGASPGCTFNSTALCPSFSSTPVVRSVMHCC